MAAAAADGGGGGWGRRIIGGGTASVHLQQNPRIFPAAAAAAERLNTSGRPSAEREARLLGATTAAEENRPTTCMRLWV